MRWLMRVTGCPISSSSHKHFDILPPSMAGDSYAAKSGPRWVSKSERVCASTLGATSDCAGSSAVSDH